MMIGENIRAFLSNQFVPFKMPLLLWCAFSLIAGICCYFYPSFMYIVIAVALLLTLKMRSFFIIICCFSLGALRCFMIYDHYVHTKQIINNRQLSGIASVDNKEPINSRFYKHRVTLKLEQIDGDAYLTRNLKNGKIQISTPQEMPVEIGDTIAFRDLFVKPSRKSSYENYLIKMGIYASLFTKKLDYKLLYCPVYNIKRALYKMRENLKERLAGKMSKTTSSLFFSIFLGTNNKNRETYEHLKDHLNYWGTVHYLARSGLHLVFIVIFFSFLCKFMPINYLLKHMLIGFFIALYALLTGTSISFTRSLLMYGCYQIGVFRNLPVHGLHIISLVCCLVLLKNPFYLFFLDFQLTFGLAFALSWFNELKLLRNAYILT